MIFESVVLSSLFYGLISAATLPLGAAVGVAWRPPDRIAAVLLAFGGGALLAALTIDLIAPGVDRGHFAELALGAVLGGFLFKGLDHLVNRQGGFLRKPSTAMTYWRNKGRERLERLLRSVHRIQPLGELSPEARDRLLSILLVREVPAGTWLYRADDPTGNLYIIEAGEVELVDPRQGGKVFPSLAEMTQQVAGHQGAAMAVFLGILLDGIPESFVIGANVLVGGGIGLSLVGGLLLANLPEALWSAAGMKEQGMRVAKILWMWSSLMIMTGLGAALGAVLLEGAPGPLFALIEGVAAGAMLTMIAETMLPEAFHKGGGVVGISTLFGFLMAVFFKTLG